MTGLLSRSIPRRILLALFAIYVAGYVPTALVVYSSARASLIDREAASLQQFASLQMQQVGNLIDALATDLKAWSELDVMNDLMSRDIDKRIARTLDGLKHRYHLAGNLFVFDVGGTAVAGTDFEPALGRLSLPEQWRSEGPGAKLVESGGDPVTRSSSIILIVPIFANFDPTRRIGTLAMTLPWSVLSEKLGADNIQVALVGRGAQPRLLAAVPTELGLAAIEQGRNSGQEIVGQSAAGHELTGDWQVLAMRRTGSVIHRLQLVARDLILLGALLAVPIILLGQWLSRRLTAPIADLTRVAREIADTDRLDARVPVTSADELGSLADTFNRMVASLQETTRERERYLAELTALNQTLEARIAERTRELENAVGAQRRLLRDISHEIKSPLARLSMAVGLMERGRSSANLRHLRRMDYEIALMSDLAGELLQLTRLEDASHALAMVPVDLVAMVGKLLQDALYQAPGRAGDLDLASDEPSMWVPGDAKLLRRAVENVVRNALFYTAPGDAITVRVVRAGADRITVIVEDVGPGVPDDVLDHLTEPFFRVDEARSRQTGGSGVGLSICKQIIERHAGVITLRHNRPTGLVVALTLPASPG